MPGFRNIRLEIDPPLAWITIDRPRRLNALNSVTLQELLEAVAAIRADDDVRVALLTGAGQRSFAAGADITEMIDKDYLAALRFAELGQRVCDAFERLDKPVVAAINGYALGAGCELALACDFAYAAHGATIGQPEIKLGIIPGFGGTQRLLRRLPLGVARELVYTGRSLDAEEALALGLINAVYPSEQLTERARATATEIAALGPLAVGRAKRLMVDGCELPLPAGMALERQGFAGLFATEDQAEGMRAFMEKRPPVFKGR